MDRSTETGGEKGTNRRRGAVAIDLGNTKVTVPEPCRRAILRLVRDELRSVGEICDHFDITQQAVSQHLHVLADARLVDVRKNGQLYVVNPAGLKTLDRFLLDLWPAGLRRLKKAVEAKRSG
jgi:DNA-binding transcriptional ArsR family regulator